MNITESNHTSVLLRALQGDPTIEAERVAESALFLQQRINDALKVCPAVDQSLILSGTVILQVNLGGPNFDGALDEAPLDTKIAEDIAAGRVTRVGSDEGIAKQAAEGKAKAAAKSELIDA